MLVLVGVLAGCGAEDASQSSTSAEAEKRPDFGLEASKKMKLGGVPTIKGIVPPGADTKK
jgi:hypothetical protein